MNFINNCRQLYNMKSLKSQPTSYKDFVQQIGKAKAQKNSNQYKIKQTPKGSNNNTVIMHSQSTSIWDKRSPSQNRLTTEVSAQKKIKSHNQSIQQTRTTPTLSQKDKVMCYHKFISEASVVLTNLFKIPVPELLTNRISYIQYLEALKALKMIYESYEPYPNDLVSQLWCQYISGQNIGNFLIIISSILGMHQSKLSQQDKYLRSKYQSMRFTRMQLNKCNSHENYQQNQCTFMPQISDRSRRLAESASKSKSKCKKSSRKVLRSMNTDKSLTERLIVDNNYHERSKASIDYDQDYNFYASTTEPAIKKIDIAGNRRSQILYEKAKQKSCEKRENKSSNDIQFEKSKKQLTFKPTILKVKSKQHLNASKCTVKGEKNTISRMIRGRVERQVRRIINEKGVPYNEKFVDKMRKQRYQQITIETNFSSIDKTPISTVEPSATPINKIPKNANNQPKVQPFVKSNLQISQQDLVIDVYLSEEHKEKLMIKKGQNIEEVAGKFIQQHGISQDKKQQLIQLLQLSISHALCPIDQLVEEEDQLASARTHHKRQYCR